MADSNLMNLEIPEDALRLLEELSNQISSARQSVRKIQAAKKRPGRRTEINGDPLSEICRSVDRFTYRWCGVDPLNFVVTLNEDPLAPALEYWPRDHEPRTWRLIPIPPSLATMLREYSRISTAEGIKSSGELAAMLAELLDIGISQVRDEIEHRNECLGITQFVYSPDYSWIEWKGKSFRFTSTQRDVLQFMHEQWQKGVKELSETAILAKLNKAEGKARLRDVFRREGKMHPAWGTVVKKVEGPKDLYRLDI